MQNQFIVFQPTAQLKRARHIFGGRFGHFGLVKRIGAPTTFFGGIHCRIGQSDQVLARGRIGRIKRNADACGHGHFMADNVKRALQFGKDRLCQLGGIGLVHDVFTDNQEFITAKACGCIKPIGCGINPVCRHQKNLIASRMTQCVIDVFKIINIEKQTGQH